MKLLAVIALNCNAGFYVGRLVREIPPHHERKGLDAFKQHR
jgi:hypothetical protein